LLDIELEFLLLVIAQKWPSCFSSKSFSVRYALWHFEFIKYTQKVQ